MANLIPFLTYVLVTTFTPGPNNILAMSHAMRFGYRRTMGFLAGVFAGFLVVMLVCGLLNFALVGLLPQVHRWLNILGAAYMVYLAVHVARSTAIEERQGARDLNSFNAGFVLQFLNLKVILYGVTVFSLFITPAFRGVVTVSLFAPVLAAIGFVATSCWALGGDIFRRSLHRHYRLFNLAMAALLLYTAVASLVPHG